MIVTRNERIEAEQFMPGSEVPVLNLLDLCKEEATNTMDKLSWTYENENARFEMYQPEVCSLFIKIHADSHVYEKKVDHMYEKKVNPGDYVVKYSDDQGCTFLTVSEEEFRKRYKEIPEDNSDVPEDNSDKDNDTNFIHERFCNFSVTFHVDDKHMWCVKERMKDGMPFIVVYKNNKEAVFSDDNCVACSPLYKALEGIKLFPANVVAVSPK